MCLRNPLQPEGDRQRIAARIEEESRLQGIDPLWVTAVISVESSFNPQAVSSSGAKGLGQMLPGTAKDMGVTDPFDIDQGVRATAKYLAWLAKCWNGNPRQFEMVLASYSSGIGTLKRQEQVGQAFTDDQLHYIALVQKTLDLLKKT
jgi:soluble lytic murein transglycosylase-like protein